MANEIDAAELYARYQRLQQYVGWNNEDAQRIRLAAALVKPFFPELINDFYAEIDNHPEARAVITAGQAQVERLKASLHQWLTELFSGEYDRDYVLRRWRVGLRHVEIGLSQVYTNVAVSRLRGGLLSVMETCWQGDLHGSLATRGSLNKLLDLDLAIIEDAYQSEYLARQQRSERLVAIGKMAGGVAHELRNPLNVIKTSVYYLLNAKSISPEKQVEHLRRIERQVGLADKVISALSDFARLPFPEVQPVAIKDWIGQIIEECSLPPEVELVMELPVDLPATLADPDQLQIALGNLIRNARDAMPKGGRLAVSAAAVDGLIEIAVADTGCGIPQEDLGRIMDPLYSTKPRGLGLGLAITRGIIEKHGGQLRAESHPGQGSTFTVLLPAARENQ